MRLERYWLMEPRFAALAADLDYELSQLDRLIQELAELRQRLTDLPTTTELRAAGKHPARLLQWG